jgi:S-DNA-T family DNA segregation ATPase FtsK/SpoIIIE
MISVFTAVDPSEEDELYPEAEKVVREAGKASTSYIQRRLGIGYARSAHLMDMLTERGVIEEQVGSRPRKVIERDA